MKRKPKGFGKFTDLLRKVASVPKERVNATITQAKADKKAKQKK